MTKTVTNRNLDEFTSVVILGELLLTYVGALFTYTLFVFLRSGELTLGVDTLRFDPHLVALAVFVVLVDRGLGAVRTRPDIQNQVPGAFGNNERIIITSITLFVGVDWYMQSAAEGLMLLGTVLFAAILAFSGIAGILLLLRWAYVGTGNGSKPGN